MKSLWNDQDAAQFKTDLEQRVYTSRLLGRDPSLVLHGGGNTSVKLTEPNLFREPVDLLYVKGSGWDLASIEAPGFAPVRMDHLLKLARLPELSDSQMANELRVATVRADAPAPSVEAILHAILPYKFVDHTHSDALASIVNLPSARERLSDIYGDHVVIIPYVMPGFALSKTCAEIFPKAATPNTIGMVLLNHGIFSFGATAKESYERMIELVDLAECYLQKHNCWQTAYETATPTPAQVRSKIAALRNEIASAAGKPMILALHDQAKFSTFARRKDLDVIATKGPATPDHVIRTKRVPLLGRNVQQYTQAYTEYFNTNAARSSRSLQMLDPAPRIVLDPELGMISIGKNAEEAAIAAELYDHTIDVISRAVVLDAWEPVTPEEAFAVEYWELEQAKLGKAGSPKPLLGEIALVTGAGSGIGKACAEELMQRGAAVVALDINPAIENQSSKKSFLGIQCDIADEDALAVALESAVRRFGGLDMLILNAGIFLSSKRIEDLDLATWHRTMRVNLDANLSLLRLSYPLLRLAPNGGRVVVNASKNVPAPGPGQGAYSTSKSALTQLARVAALEWGKDKIRVNIVHPNAVFDTGLWTNEILQQRAASYGLSVDAYKRNNVLGTEITSRIVAGVIVELCGSTFCATTGAQIPIDGGNDRVI
ncbi:MAG TPA: bifunctional aldolase/short-chain dehydrogenase [Chthoniobacterales bacterium]|jgi:rhamnose utilization protein RhaD (predicted bifunctional aldolase and dehydrogenase)/NAD(P)-dependent dehydrogenase (short-subunit alcohol dehydrogenase family)|nr:bifunctional aldolase/short-chain dehydrogenase [Chthoniobacterales bacterium]